MIKDIKIELLNINDFNELIICTNDTDLINLEYANNSYEIYSYKSKKVIKFKVLEGLKKYLEINNYRNIVSI